MIDVSDSDPFVRKASFSLQHCNKDNLNAEWSNSPIPVDFYPQITIPPTVFMLYGNDPKCHEVLGQISQNQTYVIQLYTTPDKIVNKISIATQNFVILIISPQNSQTVQHFLNAIKEKEIIFYNSPSSLQKILQDQFHFKLNIQPNMLFENNSDFQIYYNSFFDTQLNPQVFESALQTISVPGSIHINKYSPGFQIIAAKISDPDPSPPEKPTFLYVLSSVLPSFTAFSSIQQVRSKLCYLCQTRFYTHNDLLNHLVESHNVNNGPGQCLKCGQTWKTLQEGYNHCNISHPDEVLESIVPIPLNEGEEEDDDYIAFIADGIHTKGIQLHETVVVSKIEKSNQNDETENDEEGIGESFWNELNSLNTKLLSKGAVTETNGDCFCNLCNKKCKSLIKLMEHIWSIHRTDS